MCFCHCVMWHTARASFDLLAVCFFLHKDMSCVGVMCRATLCTDRLAWVAALSWYTIGQQDTWERTRVRLGSHHGRHLAYTSLSVIGWVLPIPSSTLTHSEVWLDGCAFVVYHVMVRHVLVEWGLVCATGALLFIVYYPCGGWSTH